MTATPLWRLPEESLLSLECDHHGDGHWHVMPVPGYGEARAVFIPLVRGDSGWDVALAPGETLPLTPVRDGRWTQVRRLGGPAGCRYLCALRYDMPSSHPGHVGDDATKAMPGPALAPAQATEAELRAAFALLQRLKPERIARDAVAGPADDGPCEPGMGTSAHRPHRADPAMRLRFAFASCQYPAGMLDRQVAHASYRALARYLEGNDAPERLLLMGDQVYTDATYGLLDPARLDDRYRMPYEDMRHRDTGPYSALPLDFLRRIRMTLDDHEIVDNWEPWAPVVTSPRFDKGLQAFFTHQRRRPEDSARQVDLVDRGPGWELFMADTRTRRHYRSETTLPHALMLGSRQTLALEGWLLHAPAEHLKIITSPAMLLPRSLENLDAPLYLDNWQGYPASFHRLLAFLCEHQLRNVVFLSGDAHLACRADVTVRALDSGKAVAFPSYHAPALYAPYPFANESRWNLVEEDVFRFTTATAGSRSTYECRVTTRFIDEANDGCGLLEAALQDGAWTTEARVLR